jgi:hypothetical protein
MKVICSVGELIRVAGELGRARMSGDAARIAEAQARHDDYVKVCLESDEMSLGMTIGELQNPPPAGEPEAHRRRPWFGGVGERR